MSLVDVIKDLSEKYFKEVILCGGMVMCPGLVQRLKNELEGTGVNLTVDRHFIWKNTAKQYQ